MRHCLYPISLVLILVLSGCATPPAPEKPIPQKSAPLAKPLPAQASTIPELTRQQERDIGDVIAERLLYRVHLVPDPKLQSYVNHLGRYVMAHGFMPEVAGDITFGVLDTMDIAAFSLPGGYVFVSKGLYLQVNDESELAALLAQLSFHVLRRGYLKDELGKVAGGDPVVKLMNVGLQLIARSLEAKVEFESDIYGVTVATRAGYDAYGLASLYQRLKQVDSSNMAFYNSLHPRISDRYERLQSAMGTKFDRYRGKDKQLKDRLFRLKGYASQ